jgi:ABC-type multidrug transport system fused ATPase/permease subunit
MTASWSALARLLEGSGRLVAASVAISIAQSLLLVPIAFLIRRAFDVTIPDGDAAGLIWMGALILALFLASSGLSLLTRWLSLQATKRAITRLRARLIDKILMLPRPYFDWSDLGTLHATIVQDSERLDEMANALVSVLLPAAVISVALGATLFVLDPLLAALLLCATPALVLISRRLAPRVRSLTTRWQHAFDTFSSQTQLALRGITLIKLHGAEGIEGERRRRQVAELGEAGRSMAWWQSLYTLLSGAIAAAIGVIVLVAGGVAVAEDRVSLGDLISFYAVLGLLRSQLMLGWTAVPQVISGGESLRRLERILEEEDAGPYRAGRAIAFGGSVELRRVSFGYVPGVPVLRDVSLEVRSGETVVLLGPNGAGKSTIVSLIAGLYAPDRGVVLADGIPLEELDLSELRHGMGVVVQDPLILPASVRDNIAFGRPDATVAEVQRAARLAGADLFIELLPRGYDELVGDDGVLLSGGQRQRIAVARALLGDPALLMLDEPTTHLDREGAEQLIERLMERRDGPALLVVSHDPAVAARADRVYRLVEGTLSGGARPAATSAGLGISAGGEAERE